MSRGLAIKLAALLLGGCNVVLGIEAADGPEPAPGPSAGQGGSAGSANGGGSAGTSSQAGGGGGPIDPGSGLLGTPCAERGARACNQRADKLILLCDGSPLVWTPFELCDGLFLCDGRSPEEAPNTSGSCQPIVPVCAGQSPGAVVCEGALRHVCGPDLVTSETETCASARLCELGIDKPRCPVCQPGEHACEGAVLQACSPDGLSFVAQEACMSAALCNAGAGQCTDAVCVAGQYQCNGDALETCNATQSGFDPVSSCNAGLCDALGAQCDKCVANQKRCDGSTSIACSADGQQETPTTCPDGFCIGQGQCAECTLASHCPDPPEKCKVASCQSGVCAIANAPNGTSCGLNLKCFFGECQCATCRVP